MTDSGSSRARKATAFGFAAISDYKSNYSKGPPFFSGWHTCLDFLEWIGACADSHILIYKAFGSGCAEFRAPIEFTSAS